MAPQTSPVAPLTPETAPVGYMATEAFMQALLWGADEDNRAFFQTPPDPNSPFSVRDSDYVDSAPQYQGIDRRTGPRYDLRRRKPAHR